ncbi:MAG: hypothetical protein EPO32_13460 [Anaerolineae bacterium]|nr:MAG: hypothetical protein EPO32_13460 [Anaerolineae bacterium]
MNEIYVTVYLIIGLLLRLGLPLAVTLVAAMYLRRLDARWRAEALQQRMIPLAVQAAASRPCWETKGCGTKKKNCPAGNNPSAPCWEYKRIYGLLAPACKDCEVRLAVLALAA